MADASTRTHVHAGGVFDGFRDDVFKSMHIRERMEVRESPSDLFGVDM